MMTADERRAKGLLFSPGDPELGSIKLKAHDLNQDYNKLYQNETEERARILKELLGAIGEKTFLQGPITFHYGIHTKIGSHCWIGANVVICPGVTIGDGCVIGAGSIVTRDIPARSFAAGNPCRVIRAIGPEDSIMNQPERLGGYRSIQ